MATAVASGAVAQSGTSRTPTKITKKLGNAVLLRFGYSGVNTATSVTGGGCTWTPLKVQTNATMGGGTEIWLGIVTTVTAGTTCTIAFSSAPAQFDQYSIEFDANLGLGAATTWFVRQAVVTDHGSSTSHPVIWPNQVAFAGDTHFGGSVDSGAGVAAGATPSTGYTWADNGNGDVGFYAPSVAAGSVTPQDASTVSTEWISMSVLVGASSPPAAFGQGGPEVHRFLPAKRRRAAQVIPAAVVVVVPAVPQQTKPRKVSWLVRPRRRGTANVGVTQPVVTQFLVPQPPQPDRRFMPLRRRSSPQPVPAITVSVAPQQQRKRRSPWMPRRRGASAQVPPTVTVVVAPPLPPQPSSGRRPFLPRRRVAGQPVPPAIVILPPQQPPTRARFLSRRRATPQPVISATVTLPPQPPARRRGFPRARPRSPQPILTQPVLTQFLPPQPDPVPRRFIAGHRRPAAFVPFPPLVVVTAAFVPQPGRPARRVAMRVTRHGPQPVLGQPVLTQFLPPQPDVTRRPLLTIRRRPATLVPPAQITVTTQALPPQTPARKRLWAPTPRRGRPAPVLTVTVTLPPQAQRRAQRWPLRPKARSQQPVIGPPVGLAPQPSAKRVRIVIRPRRARAGSPPIAVVVVVAPSVPRQTPVRIRRWPFLRRRPTAATVITVAPTVVIPYPVYDSGSSPPLPGITDTGATGGTVTDAGSDTIVINVSGQQSPDLPVNPG